MRLGLALLCVGLLSGLAIAQPVTVSVAGPEQIVFRWATDRCEDADIPDLPARAFRDATGQVQLLAAHYVNRRWIGPSLDALVHKCPVVMASSADPDPAQFNGYEWLAAVHTDDGQRILGFIHNEYQGSRYTTCPSGDYSKCWDNSITMAESLDGGATYTQRAAPGHRLASQPYQYEPDVGPSGYFEPSNIISRDGWTYMLVRTMPRGAQDWGTCILRSSTPGDPASWRAWDGTGFTVRFIDPYREATTTPEQHVCAPISRDQIQTMHESLTWNTVAKKWLLVGISADLVQGQVTWGIYAAWSKDLITWSQRTLLLAGTPPWVYQCGDPDPIHYPSVLDPSSASRTFATSDGDAYLYFTRFHYVNCQQTMDRDLIRVPLRIRKGR